MTTAPLRHDSRTRTRALAVAGSVLAALAVWAVAVPLLGVDLQVSTGTAVQTVGPGPIATVALAAALLGWALLALLERRTQRVRTLWTAAAVTVAALSLGGPIAGAATTSAAVTLLLLHTAVAAVLIPLLRGTAPGR